MGLSVGDRDITDIRYGDRLIEQVFAGPVEVWRRLHRWEQAGVSKTLTVPAWARYVDLVALGGGGTSGSGIAGGKGNGGVAGAFATRCWPVTPGQDITPSPSANPGREGGIAQTSPSAPLVAPPSSPHRETRSPPPEAEQVPVVVAASAPAPAAWTTHPPEAQ